MKSVKITNFDFNGAKPLETANEIPTDITDLNGLSFSGFVKGDVNNPYDMWKLNETSLFTPKGILIGYDAYEQNKHIQSILEVLKGALSLKFSTDGDSGIGSSMSLSDSGINISFNETGNYSDLNYLVIDGSGFYIQSQNDVEITADNLKLNGNNIYPQQVIENTSVSTWVSDNTYTGYDYKATIQIQGVTSNDIPEVIFGATESISGNYLPIAESHNGGIYIYSKVNDTITIPTIIIQKRSVII